MNPRPFAYIVSAILVVFGICGFVPPLIPAESDPLRVAAPAVALANRPTATPDYTACPPSASPVLADTPTNSPEMASEIARYMSFGGSPALLETALRDQWGVLNETGSVRADIDLTGEGTPDIIAVYSVPGAGGSLLVLGCAAGRYVPFYQVDTPGVPQIVNAGELNANGTPEILYKSNGSFYVTFHGNHYRTGMGAFGAHL